MGDTHFSGPVISEKGFSSGVGGTMGLSSYTVLTLPSPIPAGQIVYVSNAASTPTVAYSDGAGWRRVDTAAIVT